MKTFYRIGHLTDFTDDDPIVEGWDAALAEAKRQEDALSDHDEQPFGIWEWTDDGNATLEGIWFAGALFTP